MPVTYVTRAAPADRSDFTGPDLQASLDFVASRSHPGMQRLAIWWASPPPEQGPDAVLCIPIDGLDDMQASAAEALSRWDDRWLLIESMPARYRDEARDSLRDAIALLMLEARVKGVADGAIHDDDGTLIL